MVLYIVLIRIPITKLHFLQHAQTWTLRNPYKLHLKPRLTVVIHSSAYVSSGNTFKDLPPLLETADNTERYITRYSFNKHTYSKVYLINKSSLQRNTAIKRKWMRTAKTVKQNGGKFCGEAYMDKGRWVNYWARLGCCSSQCYGQFSLRMRFETYELFISLISQFFSGRCKPRILNQRIQGHTCIT
jgi:hypothetical protein